MPSISEDQIASCSGQQEPWYIPNVMSVALGPYPFDIDFRTRAYSAHSAASDQSTAEMTLFYDETRVAGPATDGHFDNASLELLYNFYLARGRTADLRIAVENNHANIVNYGFEFWWTRRS